MRRMMGKSVLAAGALAVAFVLVNPTLRAAACDTFLILFGFEAPGGSPGGSGLAYNDLTGSLVASLNTEPASGSAHIDSVNTTTTLHTPLINLAGITTDVKLV